MLVAPFAVVAAASPLVAVVVVDQEAREEGYALELEDLVVDDALPVDVAEGERVRIVDPDGRRHALDVAPGEAWEITGSKGEAWMSRIGEEVRTDVLQVRGEPRAIWTLAESLGAEVRIEQDRIWLVREDILFDAPWAAPAGLDHIDEIRFVPVDGVPEAKLTPPTATTPLAPRPVPTPLPPAALRQPAGLAAASAATATATAPAPAATAPPAPAGEASPAADSAPTGTDEPETPHAETAATSGPVLEPDAYVGLYLCGMGGALLLDPSGTFLHPGGSGEWYVSAPGVVHLTIDGAPFARAAIETERRYCRAVW